jgi:transposase
MAKRSDNEKRVVGQVARAGSHTVRSYQVGAMPILRRILDRMALVDKFRKHLPKESKRMRVPTAETLQILVANILIARQPIYGVGDWAVRYAPDLFGLSATQLALLQDDRIGRCLDRLFRINVSDLVMDVMRDVVQEFDLNLEELHNDSTTISFHGDYDDARHPGKRFGNPTIALTWGHNKDHRPDLKQLLYILTVTDDGGVPIYFTTANGNTADDQTHVETWNLLRQLVGHTDFLYVADCKLATKTKMQHIDKRKGRFITILPRTRKENQEFHERVRRDPTAIVWRTIDEHKDKNGYIIDTISVLDEEQWSAEKFRVLWFHRTRKAATDSHSRLERIERASKALEELRDKLRSPKTRYRERGKVETEMKEILSTYRVESLIRVTIREVVKDH